MLQAYCVAGHTFHLDLPDGSPVLPLLSQYKGFVTDPVDDPLFILRVVEEIPEREKVPLYVVEPEDEGQPRLDLYSCADGVLVETDCPYMAPVPLRGRRNEPAFIAHTFAKVAALRGEGPDQLAEQLWRNSNAALGLEA